MQSHELKRVHKNTKKKTVGRGGTRGKTAGRGTKGQNARAGHKKRPEALERIKKIPKLRGYRWNTAVKPKPIVINLFDLAKLDGGTEVSPRALAKAGIISMPRHVHRVVKILSKGDVTSAYNVHHCFVSITAKDKIEKAGGVVKQ